MTLLLNMQVGSNFFVITKRAAVNILVCERQDMWLSATILLVPGEMWPQLL